MRFIPAVAFSLLLICAPTASALRHRISLFADGRMMIGTEAGELLAVTPVRAGLAWRF